MRCQKRVAPGSFDQFGVGHHIHLVHLPAFISSPTMYETQKLISRYHTRRRKSRRSFGDNRVASSVVARRRMGKKSIRVGSEVSSFTWTFFGRARERVTQMTPVRRGRGGVRRGTRGQRKRWPPTIRFSPARSFTYSLSSLSLSLSLSPFLSLSLSRFYSLSSLCAFNLPGGRQMFAPLPLDRTTHLSPVLPPPSPPSGLQPPLPIPFAVSASSDPRRFSLLIRPFCTLLALSAENPSLSHPSSSSRIY